MSRTANNFDEVWPGIAVGNWFSFGRDSDISGFDFFMSVALETADEDGPDEDGDEKEVLSGGQTVWHYRLLDDREGSVDYQEAEILRAVARLRSARAEGKRALVTCVGGHNRSALVVAECLIQEGNDVETVISQIQARRVPSLYNKPFLAWLRRAR